MYIAATGCLHGSLSSIYASLALCPHKIDILCITGDAQSVRNTADLETMSVPNWYKELGDFYKYYNGEEKAPVLTVLIGGNHEAVEYNWELYHGGWIAPNIYFLGNSGIVKFGDLTIAGLSGIYNPNHYQTGYFESHPVKHSDVKSIYHVRSYEIWKMEQYTKQPHVMMSHDWPAGIENHGDTAGLLARKPFFYDDIQTGRLGNPHSMRLLQKLKPIWWFSSHLHVKFAAIYIHKTEAKSDTKEDIKAETESETKAEPELETVPESESETKAEPELNTNAEADTETEAKSPQVENHAEISEHESKPVSEAPEAPNDPEEQELHEIPVDETESESRTKPKPRKHRRDKRDAPALEAQRLKYEGKQLTKFLSLDKIGPRRDYLQVLELSEYEVPSNPATLQYDLEWLAIIKASSKYMSRDRKSFTPPDDETYSQELSKAREYINEHFVVKNGGDNIPENFAISAQAITTDRQKWSDDEMKQARKPINNPQTTELLAKLDVPDFAINASNPDEILIDENIDDLPLVSVEFDEATEEIVEDEIDAAGVKEPNGEQIDGAQSEKHALEQRVDQPAENANQNDDVEEIVEDVEITQDASEAAAEPDDATLDTDVVMDVEPESVEIVSSTGVDSADVSETGDHEIEQVSSSNSQAEPVTARVDGSDDANDLVETAVVDITDDEDEPL